MNAPGRDLGERERRHVGDLAQPQQAGDCLEGLVPGTGQRLGLGPDEPAEQVEHGAGELVGARGVEGEGLGLRGAGQLEVAQRQVEADLP